MFKKLALLIGILFTFGACDGDKAPESEAPSQDGVEQASPYSKPMLPAYETAAEQRVGKADWYDDYRNANLDVYGITAAPSVAVRPMAEWEDAEALILTYSSSSLPTGIKNNFVDIIDAARDVVDVQVVYDSNQAYSSISNLMNQNGIPLSSVTWVDMANDSIWARDFGPMSIFSGTKVGNVDPRYYHQRYNDDAIPTLLVGEQMGQTTYRAPLDYEGGNFMSDTNGTCAASQGLYWFNGTSQDNVNSYMEDYLGCQELIVVEPMDGEGTTHIDMQAKFLTDDTVVVGEYTNSQDSTNKAILDANAAQFAAAGFDVERIPMPNNSNGTVFRSYTNSLLVNGVHIVPVYSGYNTMQAQAMAVYESILPDWDHVTSNSDDIIEWSGAIHCITKLVAAGSTGALEPDPEIICDTYDCYPGGGSTGCGDISYEGCCDGNLLQYCDGGELVQQMCNPGTCGWKSQGSFYDCGTSGGSDPSGEYPKDCDGGCTPDCAGNECGDDGCGGSCGSCSGNETCQNGQCVAPCTPSCAGKECGADGCGGVCGTCAAGETCENNLCEPIPSECGDITFEGCCDEGTLFWCEDGAIQSYNCWGNSCGWDAGDGFYNCNTDGGEDPSGENPKNCDDLGCQPDCTDKSCGDDGCGGVCGICGPDESCIGGACIPDCVPDCAGKDCGSDSCGGSCGACAVGETCTPAGLCELPPDPCGDVGYVGCCEGNTLVWCESDVLQTLDCETCGWDEDSGFYNCGFTGQDPSGEYPLACDGSCLPDCDGKVCGDDGCGGSCGACADGEICSDQGICVADDECGDVTYSGYCDGNTLVWCEDGKLYSADCGFYGSYVCLWVAENQGYYCVYDSPCEPDCLGKECGDDGCGGSCGACPPDMSCDGGVCIDGPCEPDCTGKQCGDDGCGDICGVCGGGFHCDTNVCVPDCVPDCGGKECGADGCGGSCGTCAEGLSCSDGVCTEGPCEPDCTGKDCGSDGCDGSCGTCGDGETCEAGLCVPVCQPDCAGKQCGADGCGGSCGTCPAGFSCEAGICEEGCEPDCAGKECGPDGCSGSCGTCEDGLSCQDGHCTDECLPSCDGKQCGPDGCGGSCGDCPKDWSCDETVGACVQDPANDCGNIPTTGVCLTGNVLAICVSNEVVETDCTLTSEICSFVPEEGIYACVPVCTADCTGKTCGDDGCGGSCGDCPKGQSCEAGICEELACVPACVDRECGDDGCNGSCGTCGEGEICTAGSCVDEDEGCPEGTVLVDDECVPEDGDDVIAGEDTGSEIQGRVSSGCTAGTTPAGTGTWLALALLLSGLFLLRRRQTA